MSEGVVRWGEVKRLMNDGVVLGIEMKNVMCDSGWCVST